LKPLGYDKIKVANLIQQRSYISFFWSGVCVFWQFCKVVKQGRAPGAPPPKVGKNMIFWRKIVIFHTKYPKNFRASLRSSILFLINFNYFISIYIFI
jgi:hypothetical protein